MEKSIRYLPAGDVSLSMEFGNEISPEINKRIRNVVRALEEQPLPGLRELVPTYRSIQVLYDPTIASFQELVKGLEAVVATASSGTQDAYRIVEIPTCYWEAFGPDLGHVAEHNGLTEQEVVDIHSGNDYLLYMLGFTPGFGYLGGMDERIATPRLEVPRTVINAGSVGIAGSQTGMYPIDSPGGWQLIGRTPVKLYDPKGEPPVLLRAGDYVRFRPIDRDEYDRIQKEVEKNTYVVKIIENGEVHLNGD